MCLAISVSKSKQKGKKLAWFSSVLFPTSCSQLKLSCHLYTSPRDSLTCSNISLNLHRFSKWIFSGKYLANSPIAGSNSSYLRPSQAVAIAISDCSVIRHSRTCQQVSKNVGFVAKESFLIVNLKD